MTDFSPSLEYFSLLLWQNNQKSKTIRFEIDYSASRILSNYLSVFGTVFFRPSVLDTTVTQSRKRKRFPIGEYARQKKIEKEQLVEDKVNTQQNIKLLRSKLNYRKEKVILVEINDTIYIYFQSIYKAGNQI